MASVQCLAKPDRYHASRITPEGSDIGSPRVLAIASIEVEFIWTGHVVGELTENIIGNIVGIIVGDAVSVIVLAAEPLLLAEAVEGYFSLKVAENIGENLSK
jgi:hypothetical protein